VSNIVEEEPKKMQPYDANKKEVQKSQSEVKIQIDAIKLSLNDDSKEQDLPLV